MPNCGRGAKPVVAGALLALGSTGVDFFEEHDVAVEAVGREEYDLWLPAGCPLCRAGVPLEDVVAEAEGNTPGGGEGSGWDGNGGDGVSGCTG